MLQHPRLKAHYLVDVVDGSKVFLLAEGRHFLVEGAAVAALVGRLDGRSSVGELVAQVSATVPVMQAFGAIQKLEAGGHLVEGRPDLTDAELAYWDLHGIDPVAASTAGARMTVSVLGLGTADPQPVITALRDCGLTVSDVDLTGALSAAGDLTVVVTDDYLDPAVAELDAAYQRAGQPWLLAKPTGRQVWVGPLFVPGQTGCWRCLEQRLAGNRQVERYLAGRRGRTAALHPSVASHPAATAVVAGLIGTEVHRVLAGAPPARLAGHLLSLDTKTLEVEDHVLVQQPQCDGCGDPTLISQRSPKVALTSRVAAHTTDGGHRIQPPHLTFERMKRHISPILGAVTTLSSHDESGNGITYSFTAGHNFAMVNDNIDLLKRNLRGQSGGKGRTEIQAKVSAVCEAVERYCAVWRGDEPVTTAPYADLDPAVALHPDRVLLFSESQLAGRQAWNRDPGHRLHLVPEPFNEDLPIDWSAAWSLTDDAERLIPAGLAWYGHPDLARHFYCVGDSNGSASGNTLEEAVLQGFCELAERDAVAIWWYNRTARRSFDLDSLDDPYIATLRAFYREMDRELWVLDLTSDLEIPVFAAVSRRKHDVEDVMVGFGAHPDARLAVFRALTEVNQFLPYVDRRDEHGCTIYRTDDLETLAWCREVRVADEPWLLPSSEPPATTADFAPLVGNDLADHVRLCVDRARAVGVEVIALDQSRPDLDLSVVKMFAPGLRHFWRRLGPGRLYDVPVGAGRQATPTPEADLNPRSVFF